MIDIKTYVQQEKESLRAGRYGAPHLMIIDPTDPNDVGNKIYVRNKVKDFEEMGWPVEVREVSTQAEYNEVVFHDLARSGATAAIIQSPARAGIITDFDDIPRSMDCDGLTSRPLVLPATVRGIIDYLDACGYDYRGRAVVLGRSKIVGLPMAKALLDKNMTVTVCHSKTPLAYRNQALQLADLVVSATGRPGLFDRRDVNPWTIVVDVGINRVDGKIVGDFREDLEFCDDGWSTPVPGGVGLLTRLGLMKNCVDLLEARR